MTTSDLVMVAAYFVVFLCASFMILHKHVKDGVILKMFLIVEAMSAFAFGSRYLRGALYDPDEMTFVVAIAAVSVCIVWRVIKGTSTLLEQEHVQ